MKRPLALMAEQTAQQDQQEEQLFALLKQYFGYDSFRGKQEEAIKAVLAGRDCFCLMRTGEGKSLCYEIPALAKRGLVLVVSPLIALMENQVAALKKKQIAAEFLSSSQPAAVRAKIMGYLDSAKLRIRLLYVTPEAIDAGGGLMSKLQKLHDNALVSLVAIDEAHCISSWGHDFRPSYRRLSSLRERFSGVPFLALTATAAKKVRDDVVQSLRLENPVVLVSSFNRPNIFYEGNGRNIQDVERLLNKFLYHGRVMAVFKIQAFLQVLLLNDCIYRFHFCWLVAVRFKDLMLDPYDDLRKVLEKSPKDTAIIYCFKRESCDQIGARLENDGISSTVYHAGLKASERTKALEDWSSGRVPIVVATLAFGMGIDRANVRLVVHYNMPKTLEGFYQESGRAGRDLKPASSILYYSVRDKELMEFLAGEEMKRKLAKVDRGKRQAVEAESEHAKQSIAKMAQYCQETGCRRKKLLEHFDEKVPPNLCKKTCDACRSPQILSEVLEELATRSSNSFQYGGRGVYVTQSAPVEGEYMDSEFWGGRQIGGTNEEDSISGSGEDEDEEEEEVHQAKKQANGKSSVEQKMNALLRAEEAFNAKQNPSKKLKVGSAPLKTSAAKPRGQELGFSSASAKLVTVPETLRESVRQRMQAAMDRLAEGDTGLTLDERERCVQTLEEECFASFGRCGKSFYLSKVAGTVRWLKSASAEDCRNRKKGAGGP